VATATAFRVLLATAVKMGLDLYGADCYGAFLNPTLDEEIYMSPPEGMVDPLGQGRVLLLHKSIYGLKQSATYWHRLLTGEIRKLKYRAVDGSDCFWYCKDDTGVCMFVVHVDDLAIAYNSPQLLNKLLDRLRKLWGLSNEGPLTSHLGMAIQHEKGKYVSVSQTAYIKSLGKRFGLEGERKYATPASESFKVSPDDCPLVKDPTATLQMQEMLGAMLWVSCMTRPDVSSICGQLGRVAINPGEVHLKQACRALAWLYQNANLGIIYTSADWQVPGINTPVNAGTVVCFSDSDWAGDTDTRRSTTGFVTFQAGGPVDWKSALQKLQALSSCEAEYVAMRT